MLVELKDGESGEIFQLELTEEKWRRCDRDLLYAQELLEQAKRNENNLMSSNLNSDQADQDFGESRKHIWSYKDTLKLIAVIGSHYEELLAFNPKTKKRGWENIINDLLSNEIVVTVIEAKKKWANLIQSYNKVKELKIKTGRGPTRFNFFEQIDNIVGNKPTNCSPHSYNIGTLTEGSPLKELEKNVEVNKAVEPSTSYDSHKDDENDYCSNSTMKPLKVTRNRKTHNQEYIKTKINYLKKKEKYFETMVLLRKRKADKEEEQEHENQETIRKKLELEERKIIALEEYVAIKKEERKKCDEH